MAQTQQRKSRNRRNTGERRVTPIAMPTTPIGPMATIDEDRERNARWTVASAIVSGVILGVLGAMVGLALGLLAALVAGLVIGIGGGIVIHRRAPEVAVRAIGATPVAPGALPRVDTVLDGLSATFGVVTPTLAVLDDIVPNACIVATRTGSVIVVTTGLTESMTVVELEGVLAHLMAQQRLNAVGRGTTGAGIALLLGPLGRRGGIAHRLTGSGRLFRADAIAAVAVRYPLGLRDALNKMANGPLPQVGSLFISSRFHVLRWLFVDPSVALRSREDAFGDLDATSVRCAALEEW